MRIRKSIKYQGNVSYSLLSNFSWDHHGITLFAEYNLSLQLKAKFFAEEHFFDFC